MAWLVGGWEEKLFFSQMLCRFLLITICGSFTKTTFIGMEVVVFRGVSRKQRENGEKQDGGGGKRCLFTVIFPWCFLTKLILSTLI